MSLHSCKFGVGVGSLCGIPTFRLRRVDSQINCNAFRVDSQINSFVQSRHSCNSERFSGLRAASCDAVTVFFFFVVALFASDQSAWSRSIL